MAQWRLDAKTFPECARCPYLQTGTAAFCFACASRTIRQVSDDHCDICSQSTFMGICSNSLCSNTERRIREIQAIGVYSDELARTIRRYKYDNRYGWATIFGRVLLGYLEEHYEPLGIDLVLAVPTYVGPDGGRERKHTEEVLDAASKQDVFNRWVFDDQEPRILTCEQPVQRSAGASLTVKQERARARAEAACIGDKSLIADKRILLYDDVCTTGHTMNAMAGFLLDVGGAAEVTGVVLARAPWA